MGRGFSGLSHMFSFHTVDFCEVLSVSSLNALLELPTNFTDLDRVLSTSLRIPCRCLIFHFQL